MRARLKKKAEGRGGAQPPPRGPHLQMVEILGREGTLTYGEAWRWKKRISEKLERE